MTLCACVRAAPQGGPAKGADLARVRLPFHGKESYIATTLIARAPGRVFPLADTWFYG